MKDYENKSHGYVRIFRSLTDKAFYTDSNFVHLWLHLILKSNHKDNMVDGRIIKRGQLKTGRKRLSLETGINESKIERILKYFESENQIEQQKTKKYRVITITYYDKHQKSEQQETTCEQHQYIMRTQTKNDINDINENNDNNTNINFEEFWKAFIPIRSPDGKVVHKGDKQKAMSCFERLIKKGESSEKIINGLRSYLEDCKRSGLLSCAATTFLNQERFKREYTCEAEEYIPRKRNSGNSILDAAAAIIKIGE